MRTNLDAVVMVLSIWDKLLEKARLEKLLEEKEEREKPGAAEVTSG